MAKNRRVIFKGREILEREMPILEALYLFKKPATVMDISNRLNGNMSDASLYSVLEKLNKKPCIVIKTSIPKEINVRVEWRINNDAKEWLAKIISET